MLCTQTLVEAKQLLEQVSSPESSIYDHVTLASSRTVYIRLSTPELSYCLLGETC